MASANIYIGIMSGTSLDGIDCVACCFNTSGNNKTSITTLASGHTSLPEAIKQEILELNQPGQDNELHRTAVLDRQLGELFANSCIQLIQNNSIAASSVTAIGCHGQTLRHNPKPASIESYTIQIGDPNTIAELSNITTVSDFRRRDIAARGQGAPLVPAFHHAAFASSLRHRVIINVGGMANISTLNKNGEIAGFDTGPGNCLMDAWIQRHKGQAYDDQGLWASSGQIKHELLQQLLSHRFFQLSPPKSTGRESFNLQWLDEQLKPTLHLYKAEDIQRTLLELSAQSIASAVLSEDQKNTPSNPSEAFICGGGASNSALITRISELCGRPVNTTDQLGVDPNYVEAIAFAWLAKQAIEAQPGNCKTATGAIKDVILGGIYQA